MKKIIIFLLFLFVSCGYKNSKESPQSTFTLELTYLDGVTTTESFILPNTSTFMVDTHRGSYFLNAIHEDRLPVFTLVKNGIIRYRIITIR